MKISEKICKATVVTIAVIMSLFGTVCVFDKVDSFFYPSRIKFIAEGLAMPDTFTTAAAQNDKENKKQSSQSNTETHLKLNNSNPDFYSDTDFAVKKHDSSADHSTEETFLVTESLYRESNVSYQNFFIKNATDLTIDPAAYLNADLPFTYENTDDPQVLIVHTHATESYMDEDLGYYYESFYPRDTDDNFNVVKVGDAIAYSLEKSGVGVVHCKEHHDEPQYLGAYDNSARSINNYIQQYPSIKIILDIHRDSITTDEGEKIKPTFVYDNKKAAQIMIMCGNDNYGYYDFPDWEQNMSLAVKLQSTAETKFPGMKRPLYSGNFMYNMNLAPGSLLIEVGTDANTLEEACNTGLMLGDVIADVLKNG